MFTEDEIGSVTMTMELRAGPLEALCSLSGYYIFFSNHTSLVISYDCGYVLPCHPARSLGFYSMGAS